MEAVVLAGELGAGLGSLASQTPTPMAPVAGRPFLSFVLDWLLSQGVTRCVLAVGRLHRAIRGHFGDEYRGLALVYSVEHEPLGTGGALRAALALCSGADVLVGCGSSLLLTAADSILHEHRCSGSLITIGARCTDDAAPCGTLNSGIYAVSRDAFIRATPSEPFSLEADLLCRAAETHQVSHVVCSGYYVDIRIVSDLERAQRDLGEMVPSDAHRYPPALFLDRDGVVNVDKAYVYRQQDVEFMPGVFDTVRRFRDAGYLVVVVTNQSGIARGLYTEDDYRQLTDWMVETFRANGAPVDAFYHCPHHPDYGDGKTRAGCYDRKPEPGMLLRAAADLHIDLSRSIVVGDKLSDLEAGARVGAPLVVLIRPGAPASCLEPGLLSFATRAVVVGSVADIRPDMA